MMVNCLSCLSERRRVCCVSCHQLRCQLRDREIQADALELCDPRNAVFAQKRSDTYRHDPFAVDTELFDRFRIEVVKVASCQLVIAR